jgi:sulfate permease, SulP family
MTSTDRWSRARRDLIAGLTVAAIAVPQAMAYALIAGVDPQYGLYSAIVMASVASLFGSSPLLINGPTNAISIAVFSALAPVEPEHRVEAMLLLAVLVGLIQMAIALFKFGDLTRYISESVVLGFMAGAGLLIALSQIEHLFGLHRRGVGEQHFLHRLWLTITDGGPMNPRALILGGLTVVLVLLLRRLTRRYHLPRLDMLTALVLVALLSLACGWSEPGTDGKTTVALVPPVPSRLPEVQLPPFHLDWAKGMFGSASAVALLGLLEALTIAKSLAVRTRTTLDYNRQCFAEGIANFTGGFFQCLPGSGSLTRSTINFQAGACSRWSGVVSALAVALVVVVLAPLARYIPLSALAGILVVTAAGLVDWPRLLYAMRASRFDAGLVLTTAFVAVFISVEYSILAGMLLSMVLYIPRAARLRATELTVDSLRVVRDRLPTDPPCSRLVLFDLEGELFFGAAPDLDRCLSALIERAEAGARLFVLRIKRTRNPDVVCMEHLERFLKEMHSRKRTVLLCGVREEFARVMQNLRFDDWLPADCVFPEVNGEDSSTLRAVRRAYELLGDDLCPNCPRRREREADRGEPLYYMI